MLGVWMLAACATEPPEVVAPAGSAAASTAFTTVPVTTVPVTTVPVTTVPVTAVEVSPATVAPVAPPCSHITVVVFGNSIDAELDPASPPWPIRMEGFLHVRPEYAAIDVVDRAASGSMIVGPSVYATGPMSRLVTAIPEVMRGYSAADKARMIVLIHPSFGEISNVTAADTDESVVARAVAGIQTSVAIAVDEGVAAVVVMPMMPVTGAAEYLQRFPMNRRISAVNAELAMLGVTPASMPVSPLLDPETGLADDRYFDDFVSPGPFMAGSADGVHPDADGHAILALAMANLAELRAELAALC
jgi:hypothetical protein